MRVLIEAIVPTETANVAMKRGTFATTLQAILEGMRPEAAYFTEVEGYRTAFLVVDLQDASQIPAVAEPLFQAFLKDTAIRPLLDRLYRTREWWRPITGEERAEARRQIEAGLFRPRAAPETRIFVKSSEPPA